MKILYIGLLACLVFSGLGGWVAAQEPDVGFGGMDRDGNGLLALDEYQSFLETSTSVGFDIIDINHDGVIDPEEWHTYAVAMENREAVADSGPYNGGYSYVGFGIGYGYGTHHFGHSHHRDHRFGHHRGFDHHGSKFGNHRGHGRGGHRLGNHRGHGGRGHGFRGGGGRHGRHR